MELLIALMVFAAVTAAAWALIQRRTDTHLATQLRLERAVGRSTGDWQLPASPMLRGSRFSNIAWVERALQGLDLAHALELQLRRSGWRLHVSEFLGVTGVATGVLFLLGMLVTHTLFVALILGAVGGFLPVFLLRRAVAKRRRVLETQLIEALVMIANALKAGFGLLQALDQAARQLDDPLAQELKQTIRDTQVGSSIDDAIADFGVRVGSYDVEIVVTAILVQRNVGGNLAEILDGVAHTMRERERIRGEIRALTAQQRLTGFIIAGLPLGLAAVFFVLNPDYMSLLATTTAGKAMVAGALALEVVGAWVIKKIVSIEV